MEFGPAIYEHAARLIGRTPWEVSRDPDLLFQAHAEAYRTYHHRPVVVGIDVYNLEAEAYGAVINEPEGIAIPVIADHLCHSVDEIETLAPFDPASAGRIPMVIQVGQRLLAEFPEADVKVPVSGPFSIASNLLGFENLLCETLTEPEAIRKALDHLVTAQVDFCRAVNDRGLDVTIFESAATPPMMSPDMFRAVELPPFKRLIQEASDILGHPAACIIGGNTYPILDAMIETGTGFLICPGETDQSAFMDSLKAHPEIMVRVSMDPGILATGDVARMHSEADRIIALIGDRKKACVGAGATPYETNPEMILKAMEYVRAKT